MPPRNSVIGRKVQTGKGGGGHCGTGIKLAAEVVSELNSSQCRCKMVDTLDADSKPRIHQHARLGIANPLFGSVLKQRETKTDLLNGHIVGG